MVIILNHLIWLVRPSGTPLRGRAEVVLPAFVFLQHVCYLIMSTGHIFMKVISGISSLLSYNN